MLLFIINNVQYKRHLILLKWFYSFLQNIRLDGKLCCYYTKAISLIIWWNDTALNFKCNCGDGKKKNIPELKKKSPHSFCSSDCTDVFIWGKMLRCHWEARCPPWWKPKQEPLGWQDNPQFQSPWRAHPWCVYWSGPQSPTLCSVWLPSRHSSEWTGWHMSTR